MKIRTAILLGFILVTNLQASPPVMKSIPEKEIIKEPEIIEQPIITDTVADISNDSKANEEIFLNPDVKIIQEAFNTNNVKAIKETSYNKNKVFKINVREAMTSTIEIPENEVIKNIVVGDESSFVAEKIEDNIFMVFPQLVNKDTSITLITESKKIYPFYVKSIDFESKELPDLVFRITDKNGYEYTNKPRFISSSINKKKNPEEEIDFLEEVEIDPAKMNWDYKMKGNKDIAPYRVWNDGLFTYLDFKGKDKKNSILAYKVIDKIDTHVNVRWSGDIMIIETVGDITLKSGAKHTCIRLRK